MTSEQPAAKADRDEVTLQEHLAYLGGLRDRGIILLNGPIRQVDDPKFRGLSIYSAGAEEARRLAKEDPGVKAGWFEIEVNEWLLPSIPTMMGDRVDVGL